MLGVTFIELKSGKEYHSWDTWGMGWLEPYTIDYPIAKTHTIDIPGADGVMDLTEALNGYVHYDNRKIELNFSCPDKDYFEYEKLRQEVAKILHGRKCKIILDNDEKYYYEGRLSINFEKSSKAESTLTITGDMDPYKYELYSSIGEWLWDTFDFETDDIRDCRNIIVEGTKIVMIPGTRIPCVPKITTDSPMYVTFAGESYELQAGTTENPYIVFGEEDTEIIFTGYGIVTIDYQGGTL